MNGQTSHYLSMCNYDHYGAWTVDIFV